MSRVAASGWRYRRCGPLSAVLSFDHFELLPAPQHVVVKMLAIPLHRVDSAVINGSVLIRDVQLPDRRTAPFPRIAGCDGVGQVIAVGSDCRRDTCASAKEGDVVWLSPLHGGSWSTVVTVPHDAVHRIDATFVHLAVFASNFLTAHQLLSSYVKLQPGAVVIQNGGSSATALAVAALSRQYGVRLLTAATPGQRFRDAQDRLRQYGCELYEYSGAGAREMQNELMSRKQGNRPRQQTATTTEDSAMQGAALYLNGVGGPMFDTFLKLMKLRGHAVTYGAQNGFGLMLSGSSVIHKELTVCGHFLPTALTSMNYAERQGQLEWVLHAMAKAKFSYPTVCASSVEEIPTVWDRAYVDGGRKAVVNRML